MDCPKCGLNQPDANEECPRCGVIFARLAKQAFRAMEEHGDFSVTPRRVHSEKLLNDQMPRRKTDPSSRQDGDKSHAVAKAIQAEEETETAPEVRHLDRTDWLILASGPVTALAIMCIPFLNHIFMTFMILVHEMGHAITGWLLGCPSFPAFDLRYGGGVTATLERSLLLLGLLYGFAAWILYRYRKNVLTVIVLSIILMIHLFIVSTSLHDMIFLFMGHGTELIIAAIFFYRALSGAAVIHAAERPLYGTISWFIVFTDMRFAYRLMTSAHERRMYEIAKGGGHWMDFSRIAEDHLNVPLTTVASFFFVCSFVPLIVGFLAFRYQEFLRVILTRFLSREPAYHA